MLAGRGVSIGTPLAEFESVAKQSSAADCADTVRHLRSFLALCEGRLDDAYVDAMAAQKSSGFAETLLAHAARAALWQRDIDRARQAHSRFQGLGTQGLMIEAAGLTMRAGLAGLEGRRVEALEAYADAARRWREGGAAFYLALCGLDAVLVLGGGDPYVRPLGNEAREILTRLQAKPLLARLEHALTHPTR
jgi:hypothetical protein